MIVDYEIQHFLGWIVGNLEGDVEPGTLVTDDDGCVGVIVAKDDVNVVVLWSQRRRTPAEPWSDAFIQRLSNQIASEIDKDIIDALMA